MDLYINKLLSRIRRNIWPCFCVPFKGSKNCGRYGRQGTNAHRGDPFGARKWNRSTCGGSTTRKAWTGHQPTPVSTKICAGICLETWICVAVPAAGGRKEVEFTCKIYEIERQSFEIKPCLCSRFINKLTSINCRIITELSNDQWIWQQSENV